MDSFSGSRQPKILILEFFFLSESVWGLQLRFTHLLQGVRQREKAHLLKWCRRDIKCFANFQDMSERRKNLCLSRSRQS